MSPVAIETSVLLAREPAETPPPALNPGLSALVAPPRHTAFFIAVFLGIAILMRFAAGRTQATPDRNHVPQYLSLMAMEWLLFFFAWRGVRAGGVRVRDIVGGRWRSIRDVLVTVGWAAGFLVASSAATDLFKLGFARIGQGTAAEAQHTQALMAPHGVVEIALWLLLSASAGFCEEFVFRGYLQRQFTALTRSPARGLVIAALIFGFGHFYQGWRSVLVIAVWGLLAGLLAMWTRSLRPGIIAHAAQDMIAGFTR